MKCDICHKNMLGKYYIDRHNNKICASHLDNREVQICSSCGRFTVEQPISDGRCICKKCRSEIITTQREIHECLLYVKEILLGLGLDYGKCSIEKIPVEIVSAKKMAEIRKLSINTHNKGVTFTETHMQGISSEDMYVVGHSHKIYILSDLPKLEFLGTLAHELLHVYLNEYDIKLDSKLCEGFCNMGAYFIYINNTSSISHFYFENLKNNPDPVYGEGFRFMLDKYEKYGWDCIIKMINK